MPKFQTTYRCLIISPSDVDAERDAIARVIEKFNGTIGNGLDALLVPVRWESHAVPTMSKPAQTAINEQLVDTCDLAVAVFWSRLGQPTAEHKSGSAEEVTRILASGGRVLVYEKQAPIPKEQLEPAQYAALIEALKDYKSRGLLGTFKTVDDFEGVLLLHLTALVTEMSLKIQKSDQPIPSVGTLTAPTPDIRVRLTTGIVASRGASVTTTVWSIVVENHSSVNFHLASVSLVLDDGQNLWPIQDLGGRQNVGAKIEPGDSYTFIVANAEVLKSSGARHLTGAIASDKIGRVFKTPGMDIDPREVKDNT